METKTSRYGKALVLAFGLAIGLLSAVLVMRDLVGYEQFDQQDCPDAALSARNASVVSVWRIDMRMNNSKQ